MNFLGNLGLFGSGPFGGIIPFLLVLTVIIFFHELGHFLVARLCHVRVLVFSIGFGKELLGFNDRYGTRWKLCAIPLGGYVKFLGDEDAASTPDRNAIQSLSEADRRDTFAAKPVWQRAAIVAAGPIANFILAIVIFAAMFSIYGRLVTEARVEKLVAGSAAEQAGFVIGDRVLSIDGSPIDSFVDLQRVVSISAGKDLAILVDRDGAKLTIHATPRLGDMPDGLGQIQKRPQLGITATPKVERVSIPMAFWQGAQETWYIIDQTFKSIGAIIGGRLSSHELGGPVKIMEISAQAASQGFSVLVGVIAALSVAIGLTNLLPVPILDGGHLLFYFFEAIRGRPLSERVQDIGLRIGFAAIVMLMIFTTWNDLEPWARSIFAPAPVRGSTATDG